MRILVKYEKRMKNSKANTKKTNNSNKIEQMGVKIKYMNGIKFILSDKCT